jgi:transposase
MRDDIKATIRDGEVAMRSLVAGLEYALPLCQRVPELKAEWRRLLPMLAKLKRAIRRLEEEIGR